MSSVETGQHSPTMRKMARQDVTQVIPMCQPTHVGDKKLYQSSLLSINRAAMASSLTPIWLKQND